jgi:alpha-galactosidase
MAKIAHVGAGSAGFGKNFLADILTRPALRGSTLALMDINRDNLDTMATLARRMAKQLGAPLSVEPTMDLDAALDGADYVVITIVSHGFAPRHLERDIPLKYGVYHTSGCTSGPAGIFRGLRYIPVILDIAKRLERLSPRAWMLDYSNPSSIVPWAITKASRTGYLGLCHSVQGTAQEMADLVGAPIAECRHWAAGINHQSWMLRFEWKGKDAYPLVREKRRDAAAYRKNIVKFELLETFGYWVTESSPHNAEYAPWFRKNAGSIARYTPDHPIDRDWIANHEASSLAARETLRAEVASDAPLAVKPSPEYCIRIIEAMETNTPAVVYANVPNTGLVTNLVPGSCVEVPSVVDGLGVHPCHVGDLPPQCAALNRMRQAQDELAVKAALEGDRDAVVQAVALDPMTSSQCTLDEVRAMVDEMLKAESAWLPQFR